MHDFAVGVTFILMVLSPVFVTTFYRESTEDAIPGSAR
jgi:hypothetical protein